MTIAMTVEGIDKEEVNNDDIAKHDDGGDKVISEKTLHGVKNSKKNKPNAKKRRRNGPRVSLRTLQKKKAFLEAIGGTGCQDAQVQIMENMKTNDFKLLCNCIHDFSMNPNISDHYLSESEFDTVNTCVSKWKDSLRKIANPDVEYKVKQKLLRKKQKGGSVMLAAVIGSLIPLAVNAIEKYIWPKR